MAMSGTVRARVAAALRRGALLTVGVAVLLAGCTEEGQEAARDRLEQAIEDSDGDGVVDTEPTPPSEGTDDGTTDDRTAGEGGTAPVPEPTPTPTPEPTPEPTPTSEPTDMDAAKTAAEAEDETPSSWWLLVLLGIAVVGAAVAAGAHRHGRRRERDALRDEALLDVDWLIDVSAEHPSPSDVGPRTAAVRARADRLHRTLGMLATGSDRETATAALQLRGSVLALAEVTVDQLTAPVGGGSGLDNSLGEERQRVRLARLRLVEATR
jgi:hypothetical protein